ncbi:SH3-containing GRB2-like protein 3-interacting protein 1 isoform X6 [Gadus morhua]|nr:SH3-containing GRB2-like protein 3-interacting protein 1 isoform X6 [Gadus morhua]
MAEELCTGWFRIIAGSLEIEECKSATMMEGLKKRTRKAFGMRKKEKDNDSTGSPEREGGLTSQEPPESDLSQKKSNGSANGFSGEIDWERYNSPEVDEEGYSLRPDEEEEAAAAPKVKTHFFSSDESEEDEDHRKKFKIKIKPLPSDCPVAMPSVDQLKASICNIALSPSPLRSPRRSPGVLQRNTSGEEIPRPRRPVPIVPAVPTVPAVAPTPAPVPQPPSSQQTQVLEDATALFGPPLDSAFGEQKTEVVLFESDMWGAPLSEPLTRPFPTGTPPPLPPKNVPTSPPTTGPPSPFGTEVPSEAEDSIAKPSFADLDNIFGPEEGSSAIGDDTGDQWVCFSDKSPARPALTQEPTPPPPSSPPPLSEDKAPTPPASPPLPEDPVSAPQNSPPPEDPAPPPPASPPPLDPSPPPPTATTPPAEAAPSLLAAESPPPPGEQPPPSPPAPTQEEPLPPLPCSPPPSEAPDSVSSPPADPAPSSPSPPPPAPREPTPPPATSPHPPAAPAPLLPSPPASCPPQASDLPRVPAPAPPPVAEALVCSVPPPPSPPGGHQQPQSPEAAPPELARDKEGPISPKDRGGASQGSRSTPPPPPPPTYRAVVSSPGPTSGATGTASGSSSPVRPSTPSSVSPSPPPPPPRPPSRPKLPPGKPTAAGDVGRLSSAPVHSASPPPIAPLARAESTSSISSNNSLSTATTPTVGKELSVSVSEEDAYVDKLPTFERHFDSLAGCSRGPSPLTMGAQDTLPVAAAFTETVNAFFKGADTNKCVVKIIGEMVLSFPAGITRHFANNPCPAVLTFSITNYSRLEHVLPNPQLLCCDTTTQAKGDAKDFWVNMPNLISHLKKVSEQKPQATYYNVDMLKYQVSTQSHQSTPLNLAVSWRCEAASTDLRIDYKFNGDAMSTPMALNNVQFLTPVDGGVSKLQAVLPPAQWNAEHQRILWKIPDISQKSDNGGVGSLLARFRLSEGPSKPAPLAVQFTSEGSTLSGCDIELAGPGYRFSLVKKRFAAGKYLADN